VFPAPALIKDVVRETYVTAVEFALEATLNTDNSPTWCDNRKYMNNASVSYLSQDRVLALTVSLPGDRHGQRRRLVMGSTTV
jgi:hypothetical protein